MSARLAQRHVAVEEGAQSLRDKVTPILSSAKARAAELGQDLKQRAQDNAHAVDRYVRDNPWSFVAAGLATGLIASWFLTSRRDR